MSKFKKSILKGLTAQEVAEEAGCNRSTVYNWCNGGGQYFDDRIQNAIEKLSKKREHELSKPELETVSD